MTIKGIDISGYQSTTYDLGGRDFVIVKATEGTSYVNPRRADQVARARSHDRVVGHYHYLSASSGMTAQMDYFLEHADPQADEFLAVDWEESGVSSAEKDTAVKHLKRHADGRKVLLYCNVDFWVNRDTSSYAGDGLWIAHYNGDAGNPGIEADWLIHQYTSDPIDTNVADFGSRAGMAEWAGGTTRPTVDLSKIIKAAKTDPGKSGTPVSYKGVGRVERALAAEGLLDERYIDAHFGSETVAAYAKWQKKLGYTGSDADGIPGKSSLTKLGKRHGFDVKE